MWDHLEKACGIIQSVCSFFEEDIEWHSIQHDFLPSLVNPHSPDPSDSDAPFCPSDLDAFVTCATLIPFLVLGFLSLSMCFMGIMLHALFVALPFAHQPTVSDVLYSLAGQCLTNFTCNCHPVVHLTEVGGSCLHVST